MGATLLQKDNQARLTIAAVMAVWAGDKPDQIVAAIDSVLAQTRSPDEFIIILDGPVPVQIQDCFTAYATDKRVKIDALVENVGRGGARNHAIGHATSDVIAIMDADDICRPDRFAKQLAYLERHDLDLIGGGIEEFADEPGDIGAVRDVPQHAAAIEKVARFRSAFNHVTLMYRRTFFQKIGGYRALNYVEDWDLYLRAINAGARMGNLPDILVDVRQAISRRNSWSYFYEEIDVLQAAYHRGQFSIFILSASLFVRFVKVLSPSIVLKCLYEFVLRRKI